MSKLLAVGLLLVACGGESAAFSDAPKSRAGENGAGVAGIAAGGAVSSSGTHSPAAGRSGGGASAVGGTSAEAGSPSGGKAPEGGTGSMAGSSGEAGSSAGKGGEGPVGGGGAAQGGKDSGGAGKGGSAAGAGGTGGTEPNEPEIPKACQVYGCLVANDGYCQISEIWPAGACVQCPNHYLDCDGPAPEVYGEPGAGCETFDTNQGKCPK